MTAVTVFVSYAHESDEHKAGVLALSELLKAAGLSVVLDVWSADHRQDWYAWALREMRAADFVVVVASETYRELGDGTAAGVNRGVQSEAALLRELVYEDRAVWLPRILPVLLPGHEIGQIPLFLQPHTASRYPVPALTGEGVAELVAVLHNRPAPARPPAVPSAPDTRRGVVNQINGTVVGKVVQADIINGDLHF